MNRTIDHELNPLPGGIESQLRNLKARHAAHQAMLEEHRRWKHDRRERHRQGWHRIKPCPILLR